MQRSGDFTLAVHAGDEPDPATGALDPPIALSNAYAFEDAADAAARFDGSRPGLIYGRWRNPSCTALERKIAALEGAEDAVALASGMAAVYGALTTLLSAGDHIVATTGLYAETSKLMRERLVRFGIETTFVDVGDADRIAEAMRPATRVVYVETPANPTLAIVDIARAAEIAHAREARCVADNTFATPFHQQPLGLGADLVIHAATKGIGGHGDAIGGVVVGSAALAARVRAEAGRMIGSVMAPQTAWALSRGARTLPLRAERSSRSAMALAERLVADPRIERVHYPGLASHPGHAIAARQMRRGFGSLVAFEVRGGLDAGRRCYDGVRLVTRAVSLGDVRTLLTHPASTTHYSMPADVRARAGITDGLMRLSVGIEDLEDLWADLDRALGTST